jgi:hypothetical protein
LANLDKIGTHGHHLVIDVVKDVVKLIDAGTDLRVGYIRQQQYGCDQ